MRTGPGRGKVDVLRSSSGGSVNVESTNLKERQATGMSEFLQKLPTPGGGKEEVAGLMSKREVEVMSHRLWAGHRARAGYRDPRRVKVCSGRKHVQWEEERQGSRTQKAMA